MMYTNRDIPIADILRKPDCSIPLWSLILLKYMPLLLILKLVTSFSKKSKNEEDSGAEYRLSADPMPHLPNDRFAFLLRSWDMSSLQEISSVATNNCHKFLYGHPSHLFWLSFWPKYRKAPVPQFLPSEDPVPASTSSPTMSHLGKKACFVNAWRHQSIKRWQKQSKYDILYIPYPSSPQDQ